MTIKGLNQFRSHFMYKYLVSIIIISLATILQSLLWDYIKPATYLIFYPAIILACIYGDGTLAIILSLIIVQYRFIHPLSEFSFIWPQDYIRPFVFFIATIYIRMLVKEVVMAKLNAEMAVESLKEEKELREKFVSALTHDLQTPLTAMKLSTEMLIRGSEDELLVKKHAGKILFNMTRTENMIKDLLDANRLQAGKLLPVEIEQLDLSILLKDIISQLEMFYGNRLSMTADPEIKGYWSEEAIRRIVENLCSNAFKYGAEDSPVLVSLNDLKDSIIIKVHNYGPPIPYEDQKLLFLSFERGKTARLSGKKGWGIGLSLVRGLTESMGGYTSLNSDSDNGTEFSVTLPKDARRSRINQ